MQTRSALLSLLAAFLFTFCAAPAGAAQYRLDFSAGRFTPSPVHPSQPPPQASVTGSILFTLLGPPYASSQVISVDAISLVIGGHAYTAEEVAGKAGPAATSFAVGYAQIGGAIGGFNAVHHGADDFYLGWSAVGEPHLIFAYTLASATTSWESRTGTATVTPVPEPATWALMLAGLGMIGWAARRKGKTA